MIKRSVIVLGLCVTFVCSTQAYSFRRSFHRGYPAGSLTGSVTPEGGATTGASVSGSGKTSSSQRTVTKKKYFRMVRQPEGDFAAATRVGLPLYVELKEEAGYQWVLAKRSSRFSATFERGAAAKKRSNGVSGGDGVVLVGLQRLGAGEVEVVLNYRKKGSSAKEEPTDRRVIRLVEE